MSVAGKKPTAFVEKKFLDEMVELRDKQIEAIDASIEVLEQLNLVSCEITGEDNSAWPIMETLYALILILDSKIDRSGVQLRELLTVCLNRLDEEREDAEKATPEHPHIINGEFQSDKYPTTPRGKVPLSTKDPQAQDLLWEYARRHREIDPQFSDDLEISLRAKGYVPLEERAARMIPRKADEP